MSPLPKLMCTPLLIAMNINEMLLILITLLGIYIFIWMRCKAFAW